MNSRTIPVLFSILCLTIPGTREARAQATPPAADSKPASAEGKPTDKVPPPEQKQITESVEIEGGYRFTVETTEAPDLTEWAKKELIPVVKKWYPEIVRMLPSEGFEAPRTFSITFTDSYKGVAATMGNRIVCSPPWYRKELKREALGSVVHELVHVVQQYRGRRGGARPPGWLVEGVPDFIRWYLYEPESRGAEIKPRSAADARYDGSYRVSANFLNFVVSKFDKDLIKELNAELREGRYDAEIWKRRTGKTVEDLAGEWKASLNRPEPAKPQESAK
jgi:Peptidase of plants and bacteria